MSARGRVGLGLIGMLVATLVAAGEARVQTPPIEVLVQRLGAYVDGYERDLAAVVSEEVYQQDVAGLGDVGDPVLELHEDVGAVIDAQSVPRAEVLVDPHAHDEQGTGGRTPASP